VRVDPATNETIVRIPIPSSPCQGLVASDDAVWVCVPDGAARVDPATNTITGTIPYDVGPAWGRLAFGAGAVWALGSDGFDLTDLVRIDPVAEAVTLFPLGHPGGTIAFGFDAVWVTVRDQGLLLRVDPDTGNVTEHTSGLEDPWTVAVGPDSVWVTLHGTSDARPGPDDPTVARVDPDDGTILARIATGSGPGPYGGMWAEADAVWLRAPDLFLVRVDPATNEVVARFSGPPTSGAVTVAFGSVWATAVERQWVYRLDP
jgi:streptogramin lyase